MKLPPGYGLAVVPANAKFYDNADDMKLSNEYGAIKILVSLGQLVYASSTLYRARGDQISRYGYAAFGLTVTPYALMSLLNLLGSLMCPQYPTFYLVESRAMDEARKVPGTLIEGTVGRLVEQGDWRRLRPARWEKRGQQWWKDRNQLIRLPFALAPTATSVAIIGALSKFHKGSSTTAERTAVMTWLAVGGCIGIAGADRRHGQDMTQRHPTRIIVSAAFALLIGAAAAIYGFIVVGKELQDYGTCTLI